MRNKSLDHKRPLSGLILR